MGGKSQPDFGDVATSQGEENDRVVREQIFANRPTQYSPWGFTDWQQTPYTAEDGNTYYKWTQTTGLSPELQDIFNKQVAIQGGRTDLAGMLTGRAGAEFGQTMDWSGLNPMGQRPTAQFTLPEEINRELSYEGIQGVADPYETRQQAEDAVYNQAMSRIQPKFDEQRRAAEVRMRNQGLGPEDAAWQAQMAGIANQETDATNQALWSASGAGREEAGQMFGQQMGLRQQYGSEREKQAAYYNQAAQQAYQQALAANNQNFQQSMQGSAYANQIRQQQITEAMQKRGFSLNEINALLSGQQVGMPSMPNFSQAQASQGAPIYQGAADAASIAAANNPMNAILGMGGSALGGWFSNPNFGG